MIYAITLGYAPARILRKGLEAFYSTRIIKDIKHFYVEQHYPIDKEQNQKECKEICEKYGIKTLDPGRNLGLHHGFNFALNCIKPDSADIIIAYDPDSCVTSDGWDQAMVDTLIEKNIVWVTVMNPRCKIDLDRFGHEDMEVNGTRVWITRRAVVNSTCAWKASFLDRTGGLKEYSELYGHLEQAMWDLMSKMGYWWAFLPDHPESDHLRDLHDREFQLWKWCHAHLCNYKKDFESWLNEGMPGNPDNPPAKLP